MLHPLDYSRAFVVSAREDETLASKTNHNANAHILMNQECVFPYD